MDIYDDCDTDPDFSWIQKEECILNRYQSIELKPLEHLPIIAFFIDDGNIAFHSRIAAAPLEIDESKQHSTLSSDKLVHIIQECKRNSGAQNIGKWTWAHGSLFHIDIDINRVYQFSGETDYLKPVDFCSGLTIPASPDIFHFSSQLFLFFEKAAHLPKSILKKNASDNKTSASSTKKVRIDLPNDVSQSHTNSHNTRKTKRA